MSRRRWLLPINVLVSYMRDFHHFIYPFIAQFVRMEKAIICIGIYLAMCCPVFCLASGHTLNGLEYLPLLLFVFIVGIIGVLLNVMVLIRWLISRSSIPEKTVQICLAFNILFLILAIAGFKTRYEQHVMFPGPDHDGFISYVTKAILVFMMIAGAIAMDLYLLRRRNKSNRPK